MSEKKKHLEKALVHMVEARAMDLIEQEYTARGEAFFHVSGGGHEGIAVVGAFLQEQDWLHAHYRDKSLLLSRGVKPYDYFLALFNKAESNSGGRQMNAHMSSREHQILSLTGPVGNSQTQSAGIAATIKDDSNKPIVICGAGEGATAQGAFLEGLTLSILDQLPLLTIIEDNSFAISTSTKGKLFYQVGDTQIDSFLGCPIVRVDGRNPYDAYDVFKKVINEVRETRSPAIIVFSVDRLDSHTNADDHSVYRSEEDISEMRKVSDPIVRMVAHLHNVDANEAKTRSDELVADTIKKMRPEVMKAQKAAEPIATFTAKQELPPTIEEQSSETFEEGSASMLVAMREVLNHWLSKDDRVFLYGQDIEDPKGDVFGLTKGLSTAHEGRVVNSPLSESLILGASSGRALAGQLPVAFLQFADFFPLAVNHIATELATMYWRSNGQWTTPVIVLATSGGYKPGLGPFHAESMESLAAHMPGIDVYTPSNAADAVGLLNAAFLSGRPSLFFYPKNLLNIKDKNISIESARTHVIMPGKARIEREGTDITIVGYGNTVYIAKKVADSLAEFGKEVEIIDLRTVSPLDHKTVITSVRKTGKLLVIHEDNGSMGVGAEVLARVGEALSSVEMKRITRRDTFVPCNFSNQLEVLPSYKKSLETAVAMLDGDIAWKQEQKDQDGIVPIEAVGSSPSDETLTIMEWKIKEGDTVEEGDLIAEGEANKADVSIRSPVSGVVQTLLLEEGDTIDIGEHVALITTEEKVYKTVTKEETGTPQITWQETATSTATLSSAVDMNQQVYVGHLNTVTGSRVVDNEEMSAMSPEWSTERIEASTGIKSRHWISEEEDLVSLTYEVAKKTLEEANMSIIDVSGIICATGTNDYLTPSLAAMVQHRLLQDVEAGHAKDEYLGYAYDISSACSGFIFALSSAYNRIKVSPNETILLLTGEVLSTRINLKDYQTAPVFSDAASASIISSSLMPSSGAFSMPILKTIGEPAKELVVPAVGYISMDGVAVYKQAVDQLKYVAEKVCQVNNVSIDDIDLIVPHQANFKIIKGVARRMKIDLSKFYVNIEHHGNSSSNTIPLCLDELQSQGKLKGKKILSIAFGGGYTFGGTIIQY